MSSVIESSVAAVSYREQIEAAFPHEVTMFRMHGPDGLVSPHYGLWYGMDCVGNAVSRSYCPHTRDDVTALVEASEHVFDCPVQLKAHFHEGHYVSIHPTADHRRAIFGTADNIFPRLVISAGYDGRSFRATMGYYRDACRNLAIMQQIGGVSRAIKHTSGLRDRMGDLIREFRMLSRSWETVASTAERMQAQQVELASFLHAVYGDPREAEGRSRTIAVNRIQAIVRRVISERQATGRGSLGYSPVATVSAWEAFNAVQGFEQHDATRKGRPSAWDRMLIANRSQHVHTAESLALGAIAA